MEIVEIEYGLGLFVMVDEQGRSVLDLDAVRCHLERGKKNELLNQLKKLSFDMLRHGTAILKQYVRMGRIKRLVRHQKALKYNLWEVRSAGHGGRLLFIIDDIGQVIVSALDKNMTMKTKAQDWAISRGVKRWEKYLKG